MADARDSSPSAENGGLAIDERAHAFLSAVESELRPLSITASQASWEATTTGTSEAQERTVEAETRLRKYLSCTSRYGLIQELLSSDGLRDPLLRRQLDLLALDHRPNLLPEQVIDDLVRRSKKIEAAFYSFRAVLDGRLVTDNEIINILRSERKEQLRKAAWEASKQIAPRVAGPLLELIARRNEAAQSLGYRDFYAMQLELQEIDQEELIRLFTELKELTDEPFRRAKAVVDARVARRYGTRPEDLQPWHYDDPFFQELPLSRELGLATYFRDKNLVEIAERFYQGIGLPIDDVLARSDLEEREGKDQHAYCTDIDREGNVRILCNLENDERWMAILLHELGHAAYDKFLPRSLPWILRQPAHIATTEAIAMFMDALLFDVNWLESAAGAALDDRAGLGKRTAEARRFETLLMARWVIVMTLFERDLYSNPGRADLDAYWWDLVEELQLVSRPANRRGPDWAAKIHLAVAPVYYHNYLLGELIASQLSATVRRDVLNGAEPKGYVGRSELGRFLRDRVFAHGASRHWQDLLEQATGSVLTVDAFVDEFVREPTN